MVNFLICLIISILLSHSLAILLVEKGKDFPIKKPRIYLQLFLSKIYWKLPQMLYCTTCTSFHCCFWSDLVICILAYYLGVFYFFFPFSGIISSGLMWFLIEFLNAIDKEQNINVFTDKGDNNEK
jgi:hypothetical protein